MREIRYTLETSPLSMYVIRRIRDITVWTINVRAFSYQLFLFSEDKRVEDTFIELG